MPLAVSKRAERAICVTVAVCAALGLCALAWYAYTYDPMTTNMYPPCISHRFTGYDCPGCGTARALHAIMHGQWAQALRFNASLFVALPLVAYLLVCEMLPRRHPLRALSNWRWLPLTVLVAVVAWTVARNIWLPL